MAQAPLRRADLAVPTLGVRATVQTPQAPGPVGLPQPQGLARISDTVNQLLEQQQRRADRAAVRQAAEAGAAAGEQQPGAQMEGGGELYREAFNRAAAETGGRRLEIAARTRLDELAAEHAADPAAFGKAAAQYRDGLLNGLPAALRTPFAQAYDTLALPFHNRIQAQQRQVVAEQAIATFNEAMPKRLAQMEAFARDSIRDPAASRALEETRRTVLADLIAMGPKAGFTLGGQQYAADATRSGALSLPQMVKLLQDVQERTTGATVMGAWEAGPKTEGWIAEWERRELSPQGSGLPGEQVRRLAREMRSDLAQRRALAREGQAAAWASLADLVEQNRAALALTGREAVPIGDAQFRAAGRSDQWIRAYRQQTAFAQEHYQARETVALGTPEELAALRTRAMPGGDLFALAPAAAAQLVGQIDGRSQQQAAVGLQARVQDLEAQARAAGPEAPPVPRITPEEARAAGQPPEQRARINLALDTTEAAARTAGAAAMASPEEIAAAAATRPVAGPGAAENATVLRALGEAVRARQQGLAESPGNWVLTNSPTVRAVWDEALKDGGRTAAAIAVTTALQERIGVPEPRREALPPVVAQQLVQTIAQLPTDAERLQRLSQMLATVPEPAARAQMLDAMGKAGLPDGLRIASALAPRTGATTAARLASELAADVSKLQVPPTLMRDVETTVTGLFDDSDRLGALRAAQYQATGSAAFLALGKQERTTLQKVVTVRAVPAQSTGSGAARAAYEDLFGGRQVVLRQREGVLVSAPRDADAPRLVAGLNAIADREAERLIPGDTPAARQARQALRRGAWADAGSGYAFYPQGSPQPIAGADGQPLVVTLDQALAAQAAQAPPARRNGDPWTPFAGPGRALLP